MTVIINTKTIKVDEDFDADIYSDGTIEVSSPDVLIKLDRETTVQIVSEWFSTLSHEERLALLGQMIQTAQCCFTGNREDVVQDK